MKSYQNYPLFKNYVFVLGLFFTNNFYPQIPIQTSISVVDFGALGDGVNDDWESIQRSIDFVAIRGGGTIYFPKGEYVVYDKSLLIWGKNITITGESLFKTFIIKKGLAGWWGDAVGIVGKVNGEKYYGGFGKTNYKSFIMYDSETIPAENIIIENISIKTENDIISKYANNLGIINSRNVIIRNSRFINAPQTNIAIVNDTEKFSNANILLENCLLEGASGHNLRVISYNQGVRLGNDVQVINVTFRNINSISTLNELSGKKVHIWFRNGKNAPNVSLKINNSDFDDSGDIVSTIYAKGLQIQKSFVRGRIDLRPSNSQKVIIRGNIFSAGIKESILDSSYQNFTDNRFNINE